MDLQCPIYPQRVRKKLWADLRNGGQQFSKIYLGSIKNGSAASDLPPEGPKKERWADLTHLGGFRRFRRFRAFGGCTECNVAGRGRPHIRLPAEGTHSELRTQD